MAEPIRLQKHIAALGICSRRKAEKLIAAGLVEVNGEITRELGTKVDPEKDSVIVNLDAAKKGGYLEDGAGADQQSGPVYIMLNKPVGVITSTSSKQGMSVLDLLTQENYAGRNKKTLHGRVYPVGRLDKDSEGLVLLTNDGDLADQLTHPRYEHEKEYEITLDQPLSKDAIAVLERGMSIGDDKVKGITIVDQSVRGKRAVVNAILTEGKNRQIRKMFGRLGYNVQSLRRVSMGNLQLGSLSPGLWKYVRKDHII